MKRIIQFFLLALHLNVICQNNILFENDRIILKRLDKVVLKLNDNCHEDTSSKIKFGIKNGIEYNFDVHGPESKYVVNCKKQEFVKEYDSLGRFIKNTKIPLGDNSFYSPDNKLYCLIAGKEHRVIGIDDNTNEKFLSYTDMYRYLDKKAAAFFENFEFPGESFGCIKEIPKYYYNSQDSFIVFASNYYLYKYHANSSYEKQNGVYYSSMFENFRITPLFFNEFYGLYYDKIKGLMYFSFENGSIHKVIENNGNLKTIFTDACISDINLNVIFIPTDITLCNLTITKCLIINK